MKLLGGLFMGCGILVAGLSGLCCLLILGSTMFDGSGQFLDGLGMVAIFGGIPMAGGVAVFFAGRAMVRAENARTAGDLTEPPAPTGAERPAHRLEDEGD